MELSDFEKAEYDVYQLGKIVSELEETHPSNLKFHSKDIQKLQHRLGELVFKTLYHNDKVA